MYSVSSELVCRVAESLLESIGEKSYFSGVVELEHEGVECSLVTSVIVYHKDVLLPEGCECVISDLVPVWWEFHTVCENGEEVNDFEFSDLREWLH